jgi:hypothetical protein
LIYFQFEREKLGTVEDQNEAFSRLASKVDTFYMTAHDATVSPFSLFCAVLSLTQ